MQQRVGLAIGRHVDERACPGRTRDVGEGHRGGDVLLRLEQCREPVQPVVRNNGHADLSVSAAEPPR